MRHLSNKIATAKSTVIAQYKIGDDCFSISERNGTYYGLHNGSEILSYGSLLKDKIGSVFASIVAYISDRDNKSIQLVRSKQAGSLVQDVNAHLKSLLKKVTLEEKPVLVIMPDYDVEKAADRKSLTTNLCKFKESLSELSALLTEIREQSLTLTDGRMVRTMWGAQQMRTFLDKIRDEIRDDELWGKTDFFIEMIARSIDRLVDKLNIELSKVCSEEKRIIGAVLVPNIVTNFESLMSVVAKALVSLVPLMSIDEKFKKETSYPATWFLKGNLLDDLRDNFSKLISEVLKIPEVEKQILFPLDILKTQFISVK